MPITFRCSDCTQKLRIDDAFAGKRVACVRCGSKQRVPLVSSPEFAQAAIVRREPSPPAPPAPAPAPKVLPPKEQEPARRESNRRKSPKDAPPRHEPIWSEPVQPAEIEPPAIEREPPPRERIPSQPLISQPVPHASPVPESPVPESLPPETFLPESFLPESFLPESFLPEVTPAENPRFEEIRPQVTEPPARPRTRRAAAAHAEPSLVPPYKKLDVEEMIDMTAMVDIVFFLLIFFLVTSMHALDSTIPMPAPDPQKGAAREPRSVAAIDSDDSYVVVRIDRNDKMTVEGSEVRSDRDLIFKLRELRQSAAHPEKLLVVGHGDATHGTVVMVLDAGRELGMDQVRLTMQDDAD